ncbi:uncharacterized protein E0L32_010917 [Thyridium curvatum]|uniref:EKC/KEOPS complex subunit BUD32 n=1 Tax=Thyridium curvatum TaxID=1093900 RepID=A0A507ALZ3_9PEZI|nr:uncharacterized protein E0L32_010917 [Thyridium curvatum]TPX07214.1 hypothetical protein E0L32_010917 [Thyridium curvatum]
MSSGNSSEPLEVPPAATDGIALSYKLLVASSSGGYAGHLPHAPSTSHGTYLEGINEGLEPLEEYQKGGYHPVHLGDILGSSKRYRVIHKLGHGGFGTVWLCRDLEKLSYVAVKVMAGDVGAEELPDLGLARLDRSRPGAEYVALPLDSFAVTGPNGVHQCLVLPVLGPCVSPRLWLNLKGDVSITLQRMARQSALALHFLHQQGYCHGDFRPSNILVKLRDLNQLSEDELISLLGQPKKAYVRTESGEDPPDFSPRYLTLPADTWRLSDKYLTDQICVIDFGECYPMSSPPADLGIPENYLPPEVLLGHDKAIGPACDLWALACTLFEIRQQIPLFYMIPDTDELLAEMVRFFGKLPQSWWDSWEARKDYFDDKGAWLRDDEDWSLEVLLSKPSEVIEQSGENRGAVENRLETPPLEQRLMADLLRKMCCYEAGKRLSTEEVLNHPWFKFDS